MSAAHNCLTAFMDDPDEDKPNPIHSTGTAREYGFRGALIGGATAYGWTVASIVEALGVAWLDQGWTELSFRRPMYPGDELDIHIDEGGELRVTCNAELCFSGRVGLGNRAWLEQMTLPERHEARRQPDALPELTLGNAPVGLDLLPRAVTVNVADAHEFNQVRQREPLPMFAGSRPRVHPAWIAEQLIHLLHHSFDYGPSIHTASWIQHLGAAFADDTFTIRGHCVAAYERKGHHYLVNDGSIEDSAQQLIARLRHTAIFRIKPAG
jgi:hypothetical protein